MPASSSRRSVARTTSASQPADVAMPHAVGCGCGTHGVTDRKAVAVDADAKARNRKRLRRIEGQVRGLQKMVEDDRYCADILTQIASVHEALRAVGRELMRNHLKHCAAEAIRQGPAEADAMYDELVAMMYRTSR
jgi:DNA-binding FrmR family transcriptional regulator